MKKWIVSMVALLALFVLIGPVCAASVGGEIPPQVDGAHWSCKEIEALAKRYHADKRLPEATTIQRQELAVVLLDVLNHVAEMSRQPDCVIPREDIERLTVLHEALKEELMHFEGYLSGREAIEKLLAAKEDVPPFEYRYGVTGFFRGEGAGNLRLTDFAYAPGHVEGRLVSRVRPYLDWHPLDYLDLHLEGQWYGYAFGKDDFNRGTLYQGYIEARLPDKDTLSLRLGRQEFVYGTMFMQGADTFYKGLTFDAARLRVKPTDKLTVDVLFGQYAEAVSGGLSGTLGGVYGTYAISEGNAVEAYMFRDTGLPQRHRGEELFIWGSRLTAKRGPLSLEFEPVYESGTQYSRTAGTLDDISAYGGHLDVTIETTLADFKNKFLLGYGLASGSKNAANNVRFNREFKNVNNDTALVPDMNMVSDFSGLTVTANGKDHHASGYHVATLGWGIDLITGLNLSTVGRYYVANQVEDGFSHGLGFETDFTLTWTLSDQYSVVAAYDRFFTGKFFQDTGHGDKDVDYGYIMFQYNFSKTKVKQARQ